MITFNKNMNFSSNEVCKLLEDNKLLEIPNTSGKSTVWQKFLYLNHIESKVCIGYVICKTYKQALKHNKWTSAVVPNLFNVMDPFEDFPESCGPLK